jgi:hypothetical protein
VVLAVAPAATATALLAGLAVYCVPPLDTAAAVTV